MTNNIDAAITDLTVKLQTQMDEVSETKRAINVLLRMVNKDPMFQDENAEQINSDLVVSADRYYGRPLATCAQEYLEQRKKARKGACEVAEILKALEAGGFDFRALGWKDKDRLRSLSISLAKNTRVFHRLPNQLFGLLSWYPEAANKKERAAEQATEAEEKPEGSNANAA